MSETRCPPGSHLPAPWWPLRHCPEVEAPTPRSRTCETAGTCRPSAWPGDFSSFPPVAVVPTQHHPRLLNPRDPTPSRLALGPSRVEDPLPGDSTTEGTLRGRSPQRPDRRLRPSPAHGRVCPSYATAALGHRGHPRTSWAWAGHSAPRGPPACSLPRPGAPPCSPLRPTRTRPPRRHPGPLEQIRKVQLASVGEALSQGPQAPCPALAPCVGPCLRVGGSWTGQHLRAWQGWPVPGEAWVPARLVKGGGRGAGPAGTDCPSKGRAGALYGFLPERDPAQEAIVPTQWACGDLGGQGLQTVGPALTVTSTLTLASR